jgi:Carbohydrate esterase, sialic acid-specific acetylesterase
MDQVALASSDSSLRRLFMPGVHPSALVLFGFLACSLSSGAVEGTDVRLRAALNQVVSSGQAPERSCAGVAAAKPLVLLALGQSNAGNHGALQASERVVVIADGKCVWASDPLPGSTGSGGSIWSRLPRSIRLRGSERPVVLSVMGIDATSIEDWTAPRSDLRQHLILRLQEMARLNLMPDLVLWQQGEADARAHVSTARYQAGLTGLAEVLQAGGSRVPILLARSTLCRSKPDEAIRKAAANMVAVDARFRLGPDTDALQGGEYRIDGCHLSLAGLDEAAMAWAKAVLEAL